jgi:ATP-dependent RNA helicase DeaD
MRALVQTLIDDFDPVDIAAAALTMIQADGDASAAKAPAPELASPGHGGAAGPPRGETRPEAEGRPQDARERPSRPRAAEPGAAPFSERPARPSRAPRGAATSSGAPVVLAFNVGRDHGVRPADLVGAIAGEAGISSREIGAIRLGPDASTVEVSGEVAADVAKVMKGKFIRGAKVDVRVVK